MCVAMCGVVRCRLVHWCGAQLQAPHRAVRELGFQPEHSGVFISRWHHGSPAHRYGLFALHWILEVTHHTAGRGPFANRKETLLDTAEAWPEGCMHVGLTLPLPGLPACRCVGLAMMQEEGACAIARGVWLSHSVLCLHWACHSGA